jgi:hypothetical protein
MNQSTLLEDIKPWQEPQTGAASIAMHPGDYSGDNGVDFTAVLHRLLRQTGELDPIISEYIFRKFCLQYSRDRYNLGFLLRHPIEPVAMSWDDHTSAAAMSSEMARHILYHAKRTLWCWDDKKLFRFPILVATTYASATGKLNLFQQLLGASSYIFNCFEGKEHTSGKKSLWVAQEALYGKGFIIDSSIKLWRYVQQKRYPRGIKEVFEVYFGNKYVVDGKLIIHPFVHYAKEDFS